MAGITLFTRIIDFLRRSPFFYRILRDGGRMLSRFPSEIARVLLPSNSFFGPAKGFYSGVSSVRSGEYRGEVIFDAQPCPDFAHDSLVKSSGLKQDGHQPWPLFWMEIPDAYLCGSTLVPRNDKGLLMAEATFSQAGDPTDHAYNHIATGPGTLIAGNATSIVSRWGGDARGNRRYGGAGYWHWLFDSVARLSLMNRFPSDTKIITPPLAPWMRWFVERLGLETRVIETDAMALRVERFYFSSPSSMTGCWNPYAVDFLRHSFLPFASPASNSLPKRFYILREGYTRGIANEMEVRSYFESHGWSLIAPETLSIPDQIALFRDAEAIAGLHGSALTNLVWCSPGCQVLEFVSMNFQSGAFEWLSMGCKLKHVHVICDSDSKGLISLPPDLLEKAFSHHPCTRSNSLDNGTVKRDR